MTSYVFPALRGQMGSTEYYQANIRAGEFAAIAKTAGQLEDWKNWSIFERFQREIALKRVMHEIVPYLVRTKDRFFGAFIVLVYRPDQFQFDSLGAMGASFPAAYAEAAGPMGFLSISGGDLVVLDGQHRLTALRGVITAGDELQGPFRDEVFQDELCVIFINHETFEKTRRIFNKVNRYAKPTTDSDNILTSEDDGLAIVTRWLVEDSPPLGLERPAPPFSAFKDAVGEPLVDWRVNQLTLDAQKITTLVTVYSTVKTALAANGIERFDEKHRINRPGDRELAMAYTHAAQWWEAVLKAFPVFGAAQRTPSMIPHMRKYNEEGGLLLTPAGQQCLFHGLSLATQYGVPIEHGVRRSTRVPWKRAHPQWEDTIVFRNGRMNSRDGSVKLAGRLLGYQISGDDWTDDEVSSLLEDLREAKDRPRFRLPRPIRS